MEARIYDGRHLIGKLKLSGPEPSKIYKEDELWHGLGNLGEFRANIYLSKTKIPNRVTSEPVCLDAMLDQ